MFTSGILALLIRIEVTDNCIHLIFKVTASAKIAIFVDRLFESEIIK